MATQTLSIKTSGGDATTLSGAEALISNGTDDWVLRYDEAMTDTTACVINYAVTSGSITATVATGFRHNGTLTHSGAKLSGSGNPQLQINSDNVTVEWLDVRTSAAGNTYAFFCQDNTVDNLRIRDCIIARTGTGGATAALHVANVPTKAVIENCLIMKGGGSLGGAAVYVTRADMLNCAVHYTSTGHAYGIDDNASGNTRCANCTVTGSYSTAAYRSSVVAIGAGANAGSDTSAPGTTAYDSFDGSAFVDIANGDPHWDNVATAATYPGIDVAAYRTGAAVDIDGEAVPVGLADIGVDQIRRASTAGGLGGRGMELGMRLGM